MLYFARKNTIYPPSNQRENIRYLQVHYDDQNIEGNTNVLRRFSATA